MCRLHIEKLLITDNSLSLARRKWCSSLGSVYEEIHEGMGIEAKYQ